MKKNYFIFLFSLAVIVIATLWMMPMNIGSETREHGIEKHGEKIDLPKPKNINTISLHQALAHRRSVRAYQDKPLNLQEISELAWAAQGITSSRMGGRTAPSAGALYPLELYIVVKRARDFEAGVYHYLPKDHKLVQLSKQKVSRQLANAALGQMFISEAPVILVITGNYSVTTSKYRERGIRYVHMEAGHVAQNIYLQAESLDLGTVTVGAFVDDKIKDTLHLPQAQTPFYLMPIGKVD